MRDATTSLPKATDPDVGHGYAKVEIANAGSLADLQAQCTDAVFRDLVAKHCATSSSSVQREVVTWGADGSSLASQGSTLGDDFVACPIAGSCMVRDATTSIGKASDPDVGHGYAKVEIPGVDDLPGLQTACTDAIYRDLITKHCAMSNTPVQRVTVTWDANGSFVSEGGPPGSDDFSACPLAGSCMVRDATSSIGKATDPDVGPGYAKVEIAGVDDLPGLQAACTDAIYRDLVAKHCAVSHTPVQRVTVTWDANGSFVSEGGPTGSDDFSACP